MKNAVLNKDSTFTSTNVIKEAQEILDKSSINEKFHDLVKKLNKMMIFAGNRYLNIAKKNNHKCGYFEIEDVKQDLCLVLWDVSQKNFNKPLSELLKIGKTAVWRHVLGYVRKANLKKNNGEFGRSGNTLVISDVVNSENDSQGYNIHNDVASHFVHQNTENDIERLEMENLKKEFYSYLVNKDKDQLDIKIFRLIAFPDTEKGFVEGCYKNNSIKKRKHSKVISQTNLAEYLGVSDCFLHHRIKRLSDAYKTFQKEKMFI